MAFIIGAAFWNFSSGRITRQSCINCLRVSSASWVFAIAAKLHICSKARLKLRDLTVSSMLSLHELILIFHLNLILLPLKQQNLECNLCKMYDAIIRYSQLAVH